MPAVPAGHGPTPGRPSSKTGAGRVGAAGEACLPGLASIPGERIKGRRSPLRSG